MWVGSMTLENVPGRSLHSEVEHHVQGNFATPILYGIDNFIFYDIFFYIYISIENIFCIYFLKFLAIFFSRVIVLVQFYIILVRNGMFY